MCQLPSMVQFVHTQHRDFIAFGRNFQRVTSKFSGQFFIFLCTPLICIWDWFCCYITKCFLVYSSVVQLDSCTIFKSYKCKRLAWIPGSGVDKYCTWFLTSRTISNAPSHWYLSWIGASIDILWLILHYFFFQIDTANHILSIWFTKSKRQDGHWSRYWIILTFKLKLFPQSTWCVIFACIFWFYALNICCVQRPLYLQGRVMWLSKSTLSIPPPIGTPTSLHNYKLTKIIKNRLCVKVYMCVCLYS